MTKLVAIDDLNKTVIHDQGKKVELYHNPAMLNNGFLFKVSTYKVNGFEQNTAVSLLRLQRGLETETSTFTLYDGPALASLQALVLVKEMFSLYKIHSSFEFIELIEGMSLDSFHSEWLPLSKTYQRLMNKEIVHSFEAVLCTYSLAK